MKHLFFKLSAVLIASTLLFTSCDKDDKDPVVTPPATTPNLYVKASAEADLSTFIAAIDALDLSGTLMNITDATVFAPTNAAFDSLLIDLNVTDLAGLVAAVGVDETKNILLYHVLGMSYASTDLNSQYYTSSGTADNVGLSMFVNVGSTVMINGKSTVAEANLMASNGVIHKVDKVILPPTLADLISANSMLSTLLTAASAADGNLVATLADPTISRITLFAPDNVAFDSLLVELNFTDLTALVTALGTDGLRDVLDYHTIGSSVYAAGLSDGASVPTALMGASLTVNVAADGSASLTDENSRMSNITKVDINAVNGVMHGLDKVVLPK